MPGAFCYGEGESARRLRQIQRGQLQRANGLIPKPILTDEQIARIAQIKERAKAALSDDGLIVKHKE